MRRFLSGVIWGGGVAALGLGALSQLTPLPAARIEVEATTVLRQDPVVVEAPETAPADAMTAVLPNTAAPLPADPAKPISDLVDAPAGSEFAKPLPDTDPVAPAAENAPAQDVPPFAPATLPAPDKGAAVALPTAAPQTGLQPPKPLEMPAIDADAAPVATPAAPTADSAQIALAQPDQPDVPQPEAAPAFVADPAPPTPAEPQDQLLKPLPEILPIPETPDAPAVQFLPDPTLVPQADPAANADADAATLAPSPRLDSAVDGVIVGRLPRIGDAPVLPEANAPSGADGTPAVVLEDDADLPPLQKYARAFENPDAKALFSIILIDTGGADVDRAALAALPFPVTFALDPLAPDVVAATKIYRDGGQEVIMVATGIPEGATAADLEVTFQAHAAALPEAVAVIDTEFGAFQADRPLATQVIPILKSQGRGLISWDRGLNVADQVARREGLAAGMVYRKLDGKGENKSAVRRALDRAAFKAAQDGRVIVIGQTLPGTVAALMEWAVSSRAFSVALAPVSAVLTTQ